MNRVDEGVDEGVTPWNPEPDQTRTWMTPVRAVRRFLQPNVVTPSSSSLIEAIVGPHPITSRYLRGGNNLPPTNVDVMPAARVVGRFLRRSVRLSRNNGPSLENQGAPNYPQLARDVYRFVQNTPFAQEAIGYVTNQAIQTITGGENIGMLEINDA